MMKRNQKAIFYCSAEGFFDLYGNPQDPIGIEINVRWENKRELFSDEAGEQQISNAIVFMDYDDAMSVVFLKIGDFMRLGSNLRLPFNGDGSYKIMAFSIVPNIANTKRIVKIWL